MPGGWGVPCAPAHGSNIFTLGDIAETSAPRTCTQTPRTTWQTQTIPRTRACARN